MAGARCMRLYRVLKSNAKPKSHSSRAYWIYFRPHGGVIRLRYGSQQVCDSLGIKMVRVPTVGTDPRFVRMIVELIKERTFGVERQSLGERGPSHDVCPIDCCLYAPKRPPMAGRPVSD